MKKVMVAVMLMVVGCVRETFYLPDHTAEHERNLQAAQDHATFWQERESKVKDFYMEMK